MSQTRSRKPAQSGGPRALYLVLALVALAGVGWIAYSLSGSSRGATVSATPLSDLGDAQALMNAAQGVDLGDPDAPVHVMVFADFTCPSCRSFNLSVEPRLKNELIETGKVRYTYHDFPLDPSAQGAAGHRYGLVAARAARCAADQGRFWELHDLLFAQQQEWSFERTPPIGRLLEYATSVGAEPARFEACLNSDAHTEVIMANRLLGEGLNIPGTPTTYVDGKVLDPWDSYDALKAMVETALAGR